MTARTAADHSWLVACCRVLPHPVSDEKWQRMVPGLMRLRRQLVAAKRRGAAS